MYKRLYPNWYKSKLYPSRYKRDECGNNKVLVTIELEVWLEAKDKLRLILGSHDY